jgi:methylated-DNA-protein-cysteine methyltransferase related protein
MERLDYYERVREIVEKIPFGKVTTYGAIAQFLGLKSGARMVGWACNSGTTDIFSPIPFHRVVNRNGELSGRFHFPGNVMKERLEDEGIEFKKEFQVDLEKHLWVPGE